MTRLLLLACSARKRPLTNVPALSLYDGVFYRCYAKWRRSPYAQPLPEVLILSAKYGLIPGNRAIETYEQKMTVARAVELAPSVQRELDDWLGNHSCSEVFICMGQTYRATLGNVLERWDVPVQTAHAGIGEQQAQLYNWLRRHP